MINLYTQGAFPMSDKQGNIEWFFPQIRTIIPLDNYNYPKSLKKFFSNSGFVYKYDFETMSVVKNCASREETWISNKLIDAYSALEELGFLHSISVYQSGNLVGGLYGVSYRAAFFGESMFSKVSQASKCALIELLNHLNKKGFVLLDVQYQTDHLKMFGAKEVSLEQFDELLLQAYDLDVSFT